MLSVQEKKNKTKTFRFTFPFDYSFLSMNNNSTYNLLSRHCRSTLLLLLLLSHFSCVRLCATP